MKIKKFIIKHKKFILISFLFFISRLINIDTDFHVLEPDEGLYYGMSQDFYKLKWPIFYTEPYLETFPLFLFLGALINKVTYNLGIFFSLRLLSILGALIGGIAFYIYGNDKHKKNFAIISPILFWLSPLVFFYSRTGTMEMLYLSLFLISFVIFLRAKNINNNLIILSSILFTLSILTKFSSLIFILSYLIIFMLIKEKKKVVKKFVLYTSILLSLVIIPYIIYFKNEFINQFFNLPGKHLLSLTNLRVHLANLIIYFEKSNYLLSLPILLLFVSSLLFYLFNNNKSKGNKIILIEFIALFIPAFIFINLFNFSPRYYILLIPGIIFLISHFLTKINNYILTIVILIMIIPFTYQAYLSTLHDSIRNLKNQITFLNAMYPNYPIYSTVDPEKLTYYFQKEVKLLNNQAFKGGIIITDNLKTELFANFTEDNFIEMKKTLDCLPSEKIFYQTSSLYPHFPVNNRKNTFRIYLIKEEDNDKYNFSDYCTFQNIGK